MANDFHDKTDRIQSKSITPREKAFLKQIKDAIESNLSDENFGVNELAEEVAISRFQIHRKLRSLTGKNISQFIRETRLEKAMEYLKDDIGTVSEIAYKVGFNSPSYFNTCFRQYFETTPGEVKLLEDVDESGVDPIIQQTTEEVDLRKKSKLTNILVVSTIGIILLVALVSFLFVNRSIQNNSPSPEAEKSIAVLYFDNLSNDEENQYFADGIVESIINNLSTIKDLRVSSRTSCELFRDTVLSIDEIGRALEVAYILEGSVQKYDNQVRITANIVDVEKDQNIWSGQFTEPLDGVFDIMNKVALEVTTALNVNLNPEEEKHLTLNPTTAFPAYDLYLQGRKFYENYLVRFDDENLDRAQKLYKEALSIDSTFSMAYVGLGEILKCRNRFGASFSPHMFENADSMRDYARKALIFDSRLAEAYALMGDSYRFKNSPDSAIFCFEKALSLKNNFVEAYISLANLYYAHKGDIEEAFKNIKSAEYYEKNGLNTKEIVYHMANVYLSIEDYSKAEDLYKYNQKITPGMGIMDGPLCWMKIVQGKFDSANAIIESGLFIEGKTAGYYGWKTLLYCMSQKYDSAIVFRKMLNASNEENIIDTAIRGDANLGYAYIKTGRKEIGRRILKDYLKVNVDLIDKIDYQSSANGAIAETYAALGEYQKAMKKLLELERQNPYSSYFSLLPHFHVYEGMYEYPDFKALIKRTKEKKAEARRRIHELEKEYEDGKLPKVVS